MTNTHLTRLLSRSAALTSDSGAQVSFAVIAVAILVASGMTGAYLAKKEMDRNQERKDEELMDAMDAAIVDIEQELALCAAAKAYAVVSSWSEFPVNESRISGTFDESMRRYVVECFPRIDGKFSIELTNWTGGLFFVEKRTMDLVQSDATTPRELNLNETQMRYDRLPPASVEILAERTANPYYVAVGNFTVSVITGRLSFSRGASFERPVVSALPFIESKLRLFEASSEGEYADIGKLVQYMLTTLSQLRVLEGYGQPMYSGGMDTPDILTEQDAYMAIAVAVLMEQAKLFRGVDPDFAQDVADLCSGGSPGLSAFMGSKGRYLDPAELFLWFLGHTNANVEPNMILAQSMYGIADQLAVKLMEYFGWLGAGDLAVDYAGFVCDTVESVISLFTGEDKDQEAVTSWIRKALIATGEDPDSYCNFYTMPIDFYLPIPERQYFVQNALGDLYPVWIGNVTAPVDIPA